MGFLMMCDRCGRKISNVSVSQLKTMNNNEVVCKVCKKTEDALRKQIDKFKARAIGEMNKVAATFQDKVNEAIKQQVAEDQQG